MAKEETKEVWKDYLHEENRKVYSISNLGNVRSLNADGEIHRHSTYKNNGYRCIPYRKSNGKNGLIYLHKIMLKVWVENPHSYKRYRFKDEDYSNCTADNLEWISDEFFTSLVSSRSKESFNYERNRQFPTNAKLTAAKVAIIKKRIRENENREKKMKWTLMAKQFGITYPHLHRIRTGKMWAHVEAAK